MKKTNIAPLYIRLKNRLREYLLMNPEIRKLPSTKQLAEQYGVGKNTVTRALELLVAENLICRIRHRGTVRTAYQDFSDPQRNSRTLGLVFPTSGIDSWQDLFDGMQKTAAEMGFSFEIYLYSSATELQAKIRRARSQCAGISIYVDNDLSNPAEELGPAQYPVVIYGQPFDGIPVSCVSADNLVAACRLTSRFIQQGCSRIALVFSKVREAGYVRRRIEGWKMGCRKNGLTPDSDLIFFQPPDWKNSFETFLRKKRPQAVIFSTGWRDRQKAREIMEQSGFGNIRIAAFLTPSSRLEHAREGITIAELPAQESGRTIIQLLLDQLRDPLIPTRKVEIGIRIYDEEQHLLMP